MNWIYLLLSSLIEVFWVIILGHNKHICGFTHLVPSIISIFSMALSTYLLSLAIRSMPIRVCYAIWTVVGVIGASILGVYLFNEPVNLFEVICFILVTFGIIGLKLFDTAKQTVDKME